VEGRTGAVGKISTCTSRTYVVPRSRGLRRTPRNGTSRTRCDALEDECRRLQADSAIERDKLQGELTILRVDLASLRQAYRNLGGFSLLASVLVAIGGGLISTNYVAWGWGVLLSGLALQFAAPLISFSSLRAGPK
jgi:hypothetical protein